MSNSDPVTSDDDGLTIMLTPAQFAAAITGSDWARSAGLLTRAMGGVRVLAGGLEAIGAAGLFATPEPTMITKVAGWALLAHASDNAATGLRQLWTGRSQQSLTSQSVAGLASTLGVDNETARYIGETLDAIVPVPALMLRGTLASTAVRIDSIRGGQFSLASHEAQTIGGPGGHTILKHVGQTQAQLAARASAQLRPARFSTFTSVAEAESCIAAAFRLKHREIIAWARTAGARPQPFDVSLNRPVGQVLDRGATAMYPGTGIRIVFKKQAFNGKQFYILTAFPIP